MDEQMEDEMVVAIVPGGFKLPHKGHFEMIRHYTDYWLKNSLTRQFTQDARYTLRIRSGTDQPFLLI